MTNTTTKPVISNGRVVNLNLDNGGVQNLPPTHSPFGEYSILDEDSFQTMIAIERQRSERSRKAYALVLVSVPDAVPEAKRRNLPERVARALTTLARDTDVTGWHKAGKTVGIIFTDIPSTNKSNVLPAIVAKVEAALECNLTQDQCDSLETSVSCYPEDWQMELDAERPSNPDLYPDLVSREKSRRIAIAIKRLMDVFGSATALLLFSPFFMVIAAAIKVTSKGPVFFRQERVGQHGKTFVVLKFRSMYMNNDTSVHKEWFRKFHSGQAERHKTSDDNGNGSFKLPNDPRVTRVGRFLRRTSLDEVPQFINVLRGEMSLVGPRPPIPYEVEAYQAWHRGRVLQAKPGITGLWQVNGRSRVSFDEMVRLDLRYARDWSLWLDIKILLKTPAAVFFGEGAY